MDAINSTSPPFATSALGNWEEFINENRVSDIGRWIESAAILLISLSGVIGNILVIFVIICLKEYKRIITHW